jgi:transcriptional regulator with XRE-family HTH domain
MEKETLGHRIKDLRTKKGYSQEHLAEAAQVSLRTVQRIERGESEARGDTLQRLANALGIDVESLTISTETSERSYLIMMNFLTLLNLMPFLGLVLQFVMWFYKKRTSQYVYEYGKQLIRFQLSVWFILVCYFTLTYPLERYDLIRFVPYINEREHYVQLSSWLAMVLLAVALIVIGLNTVKVMLDKRPNYYFVVGFLFKWM